MEIPLLYPSNEKQLTQAMAHAKIEAVILDRIILQKAVEALDTYVPT